MRLFLNKTIYHIESIKKGIDAYQELADITLDEADKYWICTISDTQYDEEETSKEFENYVIALEV